MILKPLSIACLLLLTSCVYRIDIEQGNFLQPDSAEQITIGMSQAEVQQLLGTPMVQDAFHQNRWDYVYQKRTGKTGLVENQRITVLFTDGNVSDITTSP